MSNRKNGTDFEKEFCEFLHSLGFWVHNFTQNDAGQPADIVAVNKNCATLIDCKVCVKNTFPLNRIEANQEVSMEMFEKSGAGKAYFAIKFPAGLYLVPFRFLLHKCELAIKEVRPEEIPEFSIGEAYANYCSKHNSCD